MKDWGGVGVLPQGCLTASMAGGKLQQLVRLFRICVGPVLCHCRYPR